MGVSARETIDSILRPGLELRLVEGSAEQEIWSALDPDAGAQSFDSVGGVYDRVVGNRLYQKIAWGNDIARDAEFARTATSSSTGWMLDAGCGSLLFTADVHASSARPTVLFDLSIGMLERARKRLVDRRGRVPEHVVLVQGDVFALPFRSSVFDSILCPGIIHMFDRPAELFESLAGSLAGGGGLFLSSLVTDRRFGARILRLMQRSGEVPNPLGSDELAEIANGVFDGEPQRDTLGNMAHIRCVKRPSRDGAADD